jgi:hypothetical protein
MQQRKSKKKKINKLHGAKFASYFVMFLLQENPFQRAARRQQRSGSLSSSSTAGDNSDSTSSNANTCSNTASPSTSQEEHTAVDMRGIIVCFTKCCLFYYVSLMQVSLDLQ